MVTYSIKYLEATKTEDINILQTFLKSAGETLKTFRYFDNRSFDILSNHVVTIIFLINNQPICYGHLDRDENKKTWLGVCVIEEYIGLGLGKKMMDLLIDEANKKGVNKIHLSVDEDNFTAVSLYKKYKFQLFLKKNKTSFYYRDLCN